jgi:glucose-6-phosphate-specific signal transduction histidine kinase
VRYKLQGLDKDWRVADKSMNALYSYLPPGRYTLMLQVIDPEGKLSGNQTSLNIVVQTPFWKSWWFYSLLGIGAAFLLYWLDRQRMQRKEAMQKVRTDIAGGLHQDVNNALNNINILSEIARLKWDNEPQKAKEYVEQIQAKSHNMIIALDDMLWSLAPENDTMEKTILRVKEFADALTQRHGTSIELGIDKKVERLQLDMKLRHEAFLLFKEGLRSLVEAGTPNCTVHLALERGKLIFTIEFENRGCDMQQLNNLLQRRDMEARLTSLKAKLDVQVHKSRSVFLLQLPLG